MKINSYQFHLFKAGHKSEEFRTQIGFDLRWKNNSVKPLKIAIDNQIKHISLLYANGNRKFFTAIARITDDLTFHQNRTLIKAFFKSQFKYLSLTWMFHRRTINNKINLLQERALRMIFNDKTQLLKNILKNLTSLLFIILIFSQ